VTNRYGAAFVVACLVAAAACGTSPAVPSAPTLTGTWTGGGFFQSCFDGVCQPNGTLTLQLTQSDASLAGTWTSTQFLGDGPSGTMSGSVNGSSVSMTFNIGVLTPDCTFPIRVTATVDASRSQMTGTYATVSCSLVLAGNITWTKR
jgi:hypothetical protein